MNRNIKRIINELMADDRIQRMHRANIAKRQAARAARRAAMLARRNKHLPMAWDSVSAVAGDENEWLHLRCVEAIRRIEAKGFDWLDYLFDKGLLHYGAEFTELCAAASEAHHNFYDDQPREAYADRTEVDGVEVLHNTSYSDWLEMGQHWREEELKQSFENIADDDRATRIETAKRLAAEAAEHYRAAMAAMAA